jgi:hypothetical protein
MAEFQDILKKIDASIRRFTKGIPDIQKSALENILDELRKLDLRDGKIKPAVRNLRLIVRIKAKLNRLILTDDYIKEVKEFAKSFNEITKLQNEYWRGIEKTFAPKTLLKEIRNQAIQDTVKKLTEAGIGTNISDRIGDILKQNITSGGSYRSLEAQLRESLTDTQKSDGSLTKYTKQITTDSINQYNAQYTQIVSSDLGFEWFAYQGSDIMTTRPFCDAMTDFRYFHISEVPRLLKAEDLYYVKDGKRTKVPIYDKTGLPHGMIDGTNPENFFVRRGGYNCGHQIRPVSEALVPQDIKERVFLTSAYKRWKA